MVGRNVTYHRHIEPVKAEVGIIVMEIRDSSLLALLASVFADIVACSGSGNQPQIYWNFQSLQLPGGVHGNIVHSCNMSQGVEGSKLHSYAHKFIYEILRRNFSQAQILSVIFFCFDFFYGKKMYVQARIKVRRFRLVLKNRCQNVQQKQAGSR